MDIYSTDISRQCSYQKERVIDRRQLGSWIKRKPSWALVAYTSTRSMW